MEDDLGDIGNLDIIIIYLTLNRPKLIKYNLRDLGIYLTTS